MSKNFVPDWYIHRICSKNIQKWQLFGAHLVWNFISCFNFVSHWYTFLPGLSSFGLFGSHGDEVHIYRSYVAIWRAIFPPFLFSYICHNRKWLIYRVPNSLPYAKRRAHGKQPLCRVPKIKHTANTTHTEKLPLCRVPAPGTHGKNQTHGILLSLPRAVLKTHGKPRARATHVRRWRTEVDGGATEVDGAQLCVCRMGHTVNKPLHMEWFPFRRVLQTSKDMYRDSNKMCAWW